MDDGRQRQKNEAGDRPPGPLLFEQFQTVNTAALRPGVPDEQAAWLDGFIPLAPRNLRTLWGVGTSLYTAPAGATIVLYGFYNIGATPYVAILLSNGAVIQANTNTGATTTILAAGTILVPSITQFGVSQYGKQYLIIVANQPNGYWLWDGIVLYSAGGVAPGVTLTNVGSGYYQPPAVTATGGFGSGATFVATINTIGQVTGVQLANAGSGWHAGDTPTLTFSGGNSAGSGASLTAVMSFTGTGSGASLTCHFTAFGSGPYTYSVSSVTINSGGSGYSSLTQLVAPTGTYIGGGGPAVLGAVITGGVITGVNIFNAGQYTNYYTTTATATDTGYYYVSSVSIGAGGTLYGPSCTISASSGGSPLAQATMTPGIVSGVITSVNITSGGVYQTNSAPTLTVSDSAVTAAATINLMPFGISGTTVQTYQGRVWVLNGPLIINSAPGSVWNFATSSGGLQTTSSDNFIRVGYTSAIQTNGFLFLIGDSSMNYVSGVQTTGTPPTTTFTNNNSDPEIGTPYPASVMTFNEDVAVANSQGIFVSSGGTFVKRSEALDGIFNTVPNFNGQQISCAKATIFDKRVWMWLVPIVDPVSGLQVNKLLMYNGRAWWTSQQDVPLQLIASQEINSVYTAWGTDGLNLYPLFSQPSAKFTKTAQSKLWDTPGGYWMNKGSTRLWAIAQFLGKSNLNYTISVDNEQGVSSSAVYTGYATSVTWTNASGATASWTNASSAAATWYITGAGEYTVLPPQAVGQQGALEGMTVTTQCDDMVLLTVALGSEPVSYRG